MNRLKEERCAALPLHGPVATSEAFDAALVASRTRLFRVALLMLGGREDAEDVTQRTLVKALESRNRFRGESGIYTWLYRILVNTCKDRYKSRSREARWFPSSDEAADAAEPGPSVEEVFQGQQRDEAVRVAIGRLEPRLREVLVLRHYQDMAYDEMALVLGCPVGTVRSRLFAARERLRAELHGEGPRSGGG